MKVGDKLYCKTDLIDDGGNYFKKCRWYDIIFVSDSVSFITVKSDEECGGVDILVTFQLSKNNTDDHKYWNYFCTNNECRKLKLEKINEIESRR